MVAQPTPLRRDLKQVKVGVAGTGAADLDQHLARCGVGYRHLTQLARLLPFDELECLDGVGL